MASNYIGMSVAISKLTLEWHQVLVLGTIFYTFIITPMTADLEEEFALITAQGQLVFLIPLLLVLL